MDQTLPDECLARIPGTSEVIVIRRGESGYHETDWGEQTGEWIDQENKRRGVVPAQCKAMIIGSIFGWDVPGAFATSDIAQGLGLTT
jgi:hypothetical protein